MAALLSVGALPKSVRVVNLAGEPLRPELVNLLYQTGTVDKVYDLYGPSETTTYSTFTRRMANGPVTIGRPIANTRVYLLDSHLHPVPIGVPGELYIGGAGVARGYLNRPELTAEKFPSDPFSDDSSARIYRTGDLARYLPDGNIEFLGRTDNQVKIRGYRIELGEIESVLNRHFAVKESVVIAQERQGTSERELIGYVVLDETSALGITDVRTYLTTKLPAFMIPYVIVSLDVLPVTPNGKIDRSKLPSPEISPRDLGAIPIPPRSELEELIANIWRDVLQIENLTVHDNFFALGGHSLLAIQIVSRLQEAFNKEVPLRLLFDAPTIAELGQELKTIIRDGRDPELPPIVRAPRDRPLPLTLNQEHLWKLDQVMPGTHFFNMPYVYQLSGNLNVEALGRALAEIIRRHEALRTIFAVKNGRAEQVIKPALDFRLTCNDLRAVAPKVILDRAAKLILDERESPFELATGPLLRVKLLQLTNREYLLLVTMHHIISDHGSMRVFYSELLVLYRSFCDRQLPKLLEPTTHLADIAVWERSLLDRGGFDGQVDFWEKQLVSPLPRLRFGKKRTRKRQLAFITNGNPLEVGTERFAAMKALARAENVTPFLVVVTALAISLVAHTGERDVRIATVVANRTQKETEQVVGYLMNTIVLRFVMETARTCRQLLKESREIFVAASSRQQLPFEYLTQRLVEHQNISAEDVSQVLLMYNGSQFQETCESVGMDFAPLGIKTVTAETRPMISSFDLVIDLREMSTKLTGTVNFRSDHIETKEASLISKTLFRVLEFMCKTPNAPIGAIVDREQLTANS
jgi:acyl carrier protein